MKEEQAYLPLSGPIWPYVSSLCLEKICPRMASFVRPPVGGLSLLRMGYDALRR